LPGKNLRDQSHHVAGHWWITIHKRHKHVIRLWQDLPLADLGLRRQVALTVPYFVPAVLAVSGTDYLVTVPRRLAKIVAPLKTLRVIEAPTELPKFNYMMVWHPRLTAEPAQQWLREQMRAVASKV